MRGPSEIFEVLSNIPKLELEDLEKIIIIFQKYEKDAKKHPGGTKKGNFAIGADPDQHYPSDEEILVSEIGKLISKIIRETSMDNLSN